MDEVWAAGYFDGEGCIYVANARNGKYHQQNLYLAVSSTVREPLERLQQLFEGSISQPIKPYGIRKRTQWRWTTTGTKALAALQRMLPYLTVKRPEAHVALDYPVGFRGIPGGQAGVPAAARAKRMEIRQRLQELKKPCSPLTSKP